MSTLKEKTMSLKPIAELTKIIAAIGKAGKQLDAKIHLACVQAIGYSLEHGDVRFANQLLANLPEGSRKASFVAYMEAKGALAYMEKNGKHFEHFKRDDVKFDDDALMKGTKWYEFKKENVTSMYDVAKMVDSLIKKIEKGIEKGLTIEHAALLDEIKIASAQYHSEAVSCEEDAE
jgi:hypothetical protein